MRGYLCKKGAEGCPVSVTPRPGKDNNRQAVLFQEDIEIRRTIHSVVGQPGVLFQYNGVWTTCAAAALGPMAMGAVIDAFGHPKYAFVLASIFTALMFAGLLLNWVYNPARERRLQLDSSEYSEQRAVGSRQ